MNAWLAENGFARLPEAAGRTIADYVSKGWVFAAIKLSRSEAGANAPHPIKLVFPSKEAVYPMRLTAIAGGKPRFELFVIANDRASCGALEEVFCDCYSKAEYEREETDPEAHPWFKGANAGCDVGHPAICSLMWDDCVLTKLAGTIDAASMADDLHLTWKPFEPFRPHFFTRHGARGLAAIFFVVVLGCLNAVAMILYAWRVRGPRRLASYFVTGLLPAIAAAIVVAGICFAVVPKLPDSDVQLLRTRSSGAYWLTRVLPEALSKHPEVLTRTEAEIAGFLLQQFQGAHHDKVPAMNPITGADLEVDDSPGNFTVEKKPGEVVLRVYHYTGSAFVKSFPAPAANHPNRVDSPAGSDRGT